MSSLTNGVLDDPLVKELEAYKYKVEAVINLKRGSGITHIDIDELCEILKKRANTLLPKIALEHHFHDVSEMLQKMGYIVERDRLKLESIADLSNMDDDIRELLADSYAKKLAKKVKKNGHGNLNDRNDDKCQEIETQTSSNVSSGIVEHFGKVDEPLLTHPSIQDDGHHEEDAHLEPRSTFAVDSEENISEKFKQQVSQSLIDRPRQPFRITNPRYPRFPKKRNPFDTYFDI